MIIRLAIKKFNYFLLITKYVKIQLNHKFILFLFNKKKYFNVSYV